MNFLCQEKNQGKGGSRQIILFVFGVTAIEVTTEPQQINDIEKIFYKKTKKWTVPKSSMHVLLELTEKS